MAKANRNVILTVDRLTCLSSNGKELYSELFNVGKTEPEAHELTTLNFVSKG